MAITRRMSRIASAVGATLVLVNTQAHADWQYTRWGMTLEEALRASKGQLDQCNPVLCAKHSSEGEEAKLYGSYTSGDFTFSAVVLFNKKTERLEADSLVLTNAQRWPQLAGALRSKYGEPANRRKSAITELI